MGTSKGDAGRHSRLAGPPLSADGCFWPAMKKMFACYSVMLQASQHLRNIGRC
jgi:hypothetical protein